jgi:hypothetical protein
MTVPSQQEIVGDQSAASAVSWGAVIAGAVVALASSLVLIALGSGIGLVSVSPWANSGVSAETFGVLAVAWFAAIQLFSSGVGGYIAGRLRTRWVGVHTDEVFFRDTAHGFLVWAVGAVVSASLLASALSLIVSGAAHVGGAAIQGAGSVASTASGAAVGKADPSQYFTDMLFRSDHTPQGDSASTRAEVGRIFAKSAMEGDLNAADKTYVGQLVARETGLSQPDAEKRVADVVAQSKTAAADAANTLKKAADEVRGIAEAASLWAFISLLIGAFAASYMATVGGRLRDDLPALG